LKASTNKVLLGLAALFLVVGFASRAHAERKRVVILPFDGDEKAEKFHASMVKLLKKSHTVVSTAKWESTAEDLSAEKVSDGNVKKVAKKMKVDGVIEGSIQKRRDEYMIKLKLRSGTSGKVIASVSTKAEGTKLDGQASKDIKDELYDAIDNLESVRDGGGDDDEDVKPAKKPKKGEDEEAVKPTTKKPKKGEDEEAVKPTTKKPKKGEDEEDVKPTAKKPKKGEDEEDVKPTAKKPKKGEDEEDVKPSKFGGGKLTKGEDSDTTNDDEENPNPKAKKPKVAAKDDDDGEKIVKRDDEDGGTKLTGPAALTPANRAIDAVVGISLNARRLKWKADGDLAASTGAGQGKPPNYNGVPAPGALLDITAYPLAFGHKKKGVLTGIGISAMYDQALLISSQKNDGTKLKTTSSRLGFGGVFRYPLGSSPNAVVVGGRLAYGKQSFQIQMGSDLPNVNYSMIEPGVMVKLPLGKLVFNLDLGYQLISNTGQMTKGDQYGKATVSGIDFAVSGDYALTGALFARAGLKLERIGYKFDGTGTLSTGRDADPEQDVNGATDLYVGAMLTVGYLY